MTHRDTDCANPYGRKPTIFPPSDVGLRLAALSAGLPGGSASSPRRAHLVTALADRYGWDESTRGVLVWRQVDWDAVCLHLELKRGWTPEQVRAMPPNELLLALEADLTDVVADAVGDAA